MAGCKNDVSTESFSMQDLTVLSATLDRLATAFQNWVKSLSSPVVGLGVCSLGQFLHNKHSI